MRAAVPSRRVIVVGAGVTGLLTAVECARSGHRVTLLERGPVPNPKSSSSDHHRVIRTLSADDADATGRMISAHRRWLALETLLGAGFYRRVGVVTAVPRERLARVRAAAPPRVCPYGRSTRSACRTCGGPPARRRCWRPTAGSCWRTGCCGPRPGGSPRIQR